MPYAWPPNTGNWYNDMRSFADAVYRQFGYWPERNPWIQAFSHRTGYSTSVGGAIFDLWVQYVDANKSNPPQAVADQWLAQLTGQNPVPPPPIGGNPPMPEPTPTGNWYRDIGAWANWVHSTTGLWPTNRSTWAAKFSQLTGLSSAIGGVIFDRWNAKMAAGQGQPSEVEASGWVAELSRPTTAADIARQLGVPTCVVEQYMLDKGGTPPGDKQAARSYAQSVGMWAPENDPATPETELWTCTKYGFKTLPGTVPPTREPLPPIPGPTPTPTPTPTPGTGGGGIIPPQTPINFPKLPDIGAWVNDHMLLTIGIGAGVYVWRFGFPNILGKRRRR